MSEIYIYISISYSSYLLSFFFHLKNVPIIHPFSFERIHCTRYLFLNHQRLFSEKSNLNWNRFDQSGLELEDDATSSKTVSLFPILSAFLNNADRRVPSKKAEDAGYQMNDGKERERKNEYEGTGNRRSPAMPPTNELCRMLKMRCY